MVTKRGRKSSAELSVVKPQFGTRPDPPDDLNKMQTEIWRATVDSEAAGFFPTAALRMMLKDYCRHREAVETTSALINVFKADWIKSAEGAKRYHSLLKIRDMEARAAADKATKLRLTNQSRYTPQAASTASKNAASSKPWET